MGSYDLEGIAMVVGGQISDILQHKGFWHLVFQNTFYLKKQRATGLVVKTFLLAYYRECLTGEASQQYVKIGYVFRVYLGYIARRMFSEIGLICLTGIFVKFR